MKTLNAYLVVAFILFAGNMALAQRSVHYTNKFGIVVPASEAYYQVIKEVDASGGGTRTRYLAADSSKLDQYTYSNIDGGKDNDGVLHGPYYEWHKNGQLKFKSNYSNDSLSGEFLSWYESGKLHYKSKYKNNLLQDTLIAFYETGALRRTEVHDKGELISGKLYSETGEEIKFFPMMQMPVFPGGEKIMMRWIGMNVTYPKSARKAKAQGLVLVSFVINKKGDIVDAEVIKGFHPDANTEALRVVNKMPRWKPGLNEGEPVAVRYTLPVRFTIP